MPAETTVGLSDETKDALAELKSSGSESFDDVIQRLIEDYNGNEAMDEQRVRELAREETRDLVVFEALE